MPKLYNEGELQTVALDSLFKKPLMHEDGDPVSAVYLGDANGFWTVEILVDGSLKVVRTGGRHADGNLNVEPKSDNSIILRARR